MSRVSALKKNRPSRPSGVAVVLGYAAIVGAFSLLMLALHWPVALLTVLGIPLLLIAAYYARPIHIIAWLIWIVASLGISYAVVRDFQLTLTAIVLGGLSVLLLLELVHVLVDARQQAEETLERRNRELAALNNVIATITATLELEQVLQRLVDTVAEMFPRVASVTLQIVDEREGVLRTAAASAGTVPGPQGKVVRFRPGEGIAGQAMADRRSINVADVTRTADYIPGHAPPSYRSLLVTPLLVGDRVWGTLSLTGHAARAFDTGDVRLVESLARQAAIAIENAHLFQETARRAREQETVSHIVHALNASVTVEQAFPAVAEGLQQLTDCGRVSLVLFDDQRGQFTVVALNSPVPGLDRGKAFPYSAMPFIQALQKGRAHLTPDLSEGSESPIRKKLIEAGFRSSVNLPLIAGEKAIGGLNLASRKPSAFTERDIPLLQQIADALAAAIVKSELLGRAQAAEAQYRGLFENSGDPIAVVDTKGIILDVNPAACEIAGLSRGELLGHPVAVINEVEKEDLQRVIRAAMNGEVFSYPFSIAVGGKRRHFEARFERIDQPHGSAVQWVAHDVTDRRELDHWREELTGITVHNLRNPLTWIQTGTEAARMFLPDDIDPDVVFALDKAIKGTARLEQQIDLLLNINRAEAGQELTDKVPLAPASFVNDVVELLNPRATSRKVQLLTQLPGSLPTVLGNRNMIAWTLENLVDNAIKFSSENGIVIVQADVGEKGDSEAELRISVTDHGPGVPPADRERIFGKFYQVRRVEGQKGSGMGLYFCRLATEAHGGRIWVEDNREGQGSTFTFTLPV